MKGAWQIGIFCMSMMAISGYGCKSHAPSDAPEASAPATVANATDTDSNHLYHNSPSIKGATMSIRQSVLAGQWYARDAKQLRSSIESYLADAQRTATKSGTDAADSLGTIHAIVVPHAGHVWSGPTAAAAYRILKNHHYKRIFILCPNHRMPVYGVVSVSADAFETPLGPVAVDSATVESLRNAGLVRIDDAAHRREHAIEIQLPFIQVVFGDDLPQIVPLIVGDIDQQFAQNFAQYYRANIADDALIVVSSDFLHYGEAYGYVPFGDPIQAQIEAYDAKTVKAFSLLDAPAFDEFADAHPHAACGINALRLAAHIYDGQAQTVTQLAYDTSGRRSGDDDMSVSYVALAITDNASPSNSNKDADHIHKKGDPMLNESQRATAHDLVKRALAQAVSKGRETPMPSDEPAAKEAPFNERFGVFVTLHDASGDLRGCIGNILPVATLAEGLWGRAQDAALNDPRFDPVTPAELSSLSIEISVLSRPVSVASPNDIEIGRHGILLKKRGRSAVFLPQVAPEQGWNLETTLNHLALKAGLAPGAWREGASFEVFEAEVF